MAADVPRDPRAKPQIIFHLLDRMPFRRIRPKPSYESVRHDLLYLGMSRSWLLRMLLDGRDLPRPPAAELLATIESLSVEAARRLRCDFDVLTHRFLPRTQPSQSASVPTRHVAMMARAPTDLATELTSNEAAKGATVPFRLCLPSDELYLKFLFGHQHLLPAATDAREALRRAITVRLALHCVLVAVSFLVAPFIRAVLRSLCYKHRPTTSVTNLPPHTAYSFARSCLEIHRARDRIRDTSGGVSLVVMG
jgi:hypothetical protein